MSPRIAQRRLTRKRLAVNTVALLLLLLIVAGVALCIGTSFVSPAAIARSISSADGGGVVRAIVFELRLPRVLLAISVGGALAASGVVFQSILRNPLAEPYILGISNGCAVGAIVGFLIGATGVLQPLLSFAGGLAFVLAVLAISRDSFGVRSDSMLLGGAMVGAIGAALIFLLLHFLGPQLRTAIQWMLGDLSSAGAGIGYGSSLFFLLLIGASFFFGDTLNALAMGDEEAESLGVDTRRARIIAYVAGSFIVGMAVSYCGAIGFVGLVVPHILRRIFGADHRSLLPLSVVGGGIFLLLCDTIARSLLPAVGSGASELPVGAITALVGAPLFIYLLRRNGG